MEVYRLLRTDEDDLRYGITAKAPNQPSSVVLHVAHGSYKPSRFISACGSKDHAIRFRAKNQQKGFLNGPIVKINIDAGMAIYDLRTYDQRQQILASDNVNFLQYAFISDIQLQDTIRRFHTFADADQEVLIVDHIPFKNIVVLDV